MEIIAELEKRAPWHLRRSGRLRQLQPAHLDTCIAIRTMVLKDGVAYLQAGGGIVYDSVPETEFQESVNKMRALERAIDQAEVVAAELPAGSLGYG